MLDRDTHVCELCHVIVGILWRKRARWLPWRTGKLLYYMKMMYTLVLIGLFAVHIPYCYMVLLGQRNLNTLYVRNVYSTLLINRNFAGETFFVFGTSNFSSYLKHVDFSFYFMIV